MSEIEFSSAAEAQAVPMGQPLLAQDLSPKPCNMTKADVMAYAEDISRKVGYSPAEPIEGVVERLGGRLSTLGLSDMVEGIDGSIRVNGIRDFVINTSLLSGDARNRFTIAHEIGHYFLHSPNNPDNKLIARRYDSGRTEWEANWFAAAFLMPEQQFKEQFESLGRRIIDVANYFKVSLEAATYRAEYLKLI